MNVVRLAKTSFPGPAPRTSMGGPGAGGAHLKGSLPHSGRAQPVLLVGLEEDQAPGELFEDLCLEGLLNELGLLRRGDTGVEFEEPKDALEGLHPSDCCYAGVCHDMPLSLCLAVYTRTGPACV